LNPDKGSPEDFRQDPAVVSRILRERARALAKPSGERASELPAVQIFMFRLGGASYGLATSFVREVVSRPKLVSLPRTSDFLLGICVVHGELLPVFDLLRLLDSPPTKPSPEWPMIVVGEKAPEFGLLAEDVIPSRPVSIEEILAGAATSESRVVRGITPGGTAILDGRTVLSDPRLFL
jgi:purine-binding chemotaxis protein CheW